MKQKLLKLQEKIDAMSLRERAMMFAAAAACVVFVLHTLMLAPLFSRQKVLQAQISQQQNNIEGMNAEIANVVRAHAIDPDQANRVRLAELDAELAALNDSLRTMQSGLVPPQHIAALLERILDRHGRLQLLALESLAPRPLTEGLVAPPAVPAVPVVPVVSVEPMAPLATVSPAGQIYRHGVQLVVRGNYLDMIDYMQALEAMPTQVFWGKASLEVETYPDARLTLTLYTLSLDQKWMKL